MAGMISLDCPIPDPVHDVRVVNSGCNGVDNSSQRRIYSYRGKDDNKSIVIMITVPIVVLIMMLMMIT